MTQEEYIEAMKRWGNGERMVPEAYVGGFENVCNHFAHWLDVQSRINKGDYVVEVGCGCGMSSRIYSLKSETQLSAIDKLEVIEICKIAYPTPGVIYSGIDLNKPNWAYDAGADVVVCIDVIEHVENKDIFLNELAILANEKTRYILSTPVGDDEISWHIHHWQSIEEFMDDVCRFLPRERVTRI